MIDVETLLRNHFPDVEKRQGPVYKATVTLLKKLLHQDEINSFIESNQHLEGFEFNDAVLDHFDFSFRISNRDRDRIPAQGRVLIVANHPLGSLDGLALLKMVSEIRPDVRIVATTLLNQISPLNNLFLSVDNLSKKASHLKSMRRIVKALEADQAVIMFPTGEVSRIRPNGIRDGKWKTGFLHLAAKTAAPIVPIYIDAKNSAMFYGLSSLYKPLGTIMLVNEMFNKHNVEISLRVGKPIPWEAIDGLDMPKKKIAKRMRKQVYRLAKKNKPKLFDTIENVIHPAKSKLIRNELKQSQLIGSTEDGKQIYLFDYQPNSSVMREIGRLRELSFRAVREGTGNALDVDSYDRYYRHLILWDEDELEIVGAYRIGETAGIIQAKGLRGLYTHSLFEFNDMLLPYLDESIELGRSFIQPRYWGRRSLDYLWYGIGAYLQQNPHIKYMFGPVSLSASYPLPARKLIASFYDELFSSDIELAQPRAPFEFPRYELFAPYRAVSSEGDYKQAFSLLKETLDSMGVRVPTLYKQYVELCYPGGCEFLGFNVDADFSDCIDAMILVHLDAVKEKKRERYINSHVASAKAAVGNAA
ncbi:MAG: lysophospholipid acyltransferase family protein [Chromatiales bacterium]|jgi:putative hemolysin